MNKLALRLDDLRVDSFETVSGGARARGTVAGYESEYEATFTQLPQETQDGCWPRTLDAPCETRVFVCVGSKNCAGDYMNEVGW